jgi:sugar/nucleoside kinase (ribokinase family)
MKPDLLVVGHIVKDVVNDGWLPGGGVLYAAAQAHALGLKVAAVTRCSVDLLPSQILPEVEWLVKPSSVSTSFENRYVEGHREQRLVALAPPLTFADLPDGWRQASIVLLAPVFQDVDPAMVNAFGAGQLVGVGAQGWLRHRDGDRVLPGKIVQQPDWIGGSRVVFVSEEDITDPDRVKLWQTETRTVVLTRGLSGCSVWDASGRFDVDGISVSEVDATGAGDVFAAAFLIRRVETGDNREAALFATAAAALAVQQVGTAGIGSRAAIEALMLREAVRA